MLRHTAGFVVAVLASLLMTGVGLAQGEGLIEGQVLSATAGDVPVVGAIVTLRIWQADEELLSLEASSDEDGQFSFSNLEVLDHEYQLMVGHEDVTYAFARKSFLPGENSISVPLTVYESTYDVGVVTVERAHVIVDGDAEHLHIQEVHILTNTGNATYVPRSLETGEGALRFPFPAEAANPEWLGGFSPGSVGISEGGFHMDAPFLPGTVEVTFSYTLPFSRSPYMVEMTFPYRVGHLDVFVTANGIEASAPTLVREDPIAMQAGHYNRFSGDELPAGTTVSIEFKRPESQQATPEVMPPAGGSGATTVIVIVVIVVSVLLILVYPFIRRGRRKTG